MNLFTESVSKCVDNLRTNRFFEARLGFTRDACGLGNVRIHQVGLTGCLWQSGIGHKAKQFNIPTNFCYIFNINYIV